MLEHDQLTFEQLQPQPSYGFSMVDFVRILFKRSKVILSFFLATVLTTILLLLLLSKPLYHTDAKLMMEIGKEHIFDPALMTTDSARPVIKYNTNQQSAFAREVLLGHYLLDKVVRQIGYNNIYKWDELPADDENNDEEYLIETTVKILQEELSVSPIKNSNLLNVSLEHEDPEIAANVVNTLIRLFIDRHMIIRNDEEKRDFYLQQAKQLEEKLKKNESALQALKQKNGILSSLPDEKRMLIEQQMKLKASHEDTLIRMQEVEERIAQLQDQLGNTSDNPQALASLNQRLLDLQAEESKLLSSFNSTSRVVVNVRNEINSVKAQLKKLGSDKAYGNNPTASGTSLHSRLQDSLLDQQVEQGALKATAAAQQSQLEKNRNKILLLDKMEKALERQEEQILIDQKNYKMFLSKYEQTSITNAMDEKGITNIRIVEPAYVPSRPVSGKRRLAVLASMIFGLLGGIGLAYLLELLGPTIDTRRDVEKYLGVPVLATVPATLLPAAGHQLQ